MVGSLAGVSPLGGCCCPFQALALQGSDNRVLCSGPSTGLNQEDPSQLLTLTGWGVLVRMSRGHLLQISGGVGSVQ